MKKGAQERANCNFVSRSKVDLNAITQTQPLSAVTQATPSLVRRQGELVRLPLGGASSPSMCAHGRTRLSLITPTTTAAATALFSAASGPRCVHLLVGGTAQRHRRRAAVRRPRDASRGRRRSSTSGRPAPSTTAAPTLSQVTPAPPRSNPRLCIAAVQHAQFPTTHDLMLTECSTCYTGPHAAAFAAAASDCCCCGYAGGAGATRAPWKRAGWML